MYLMKICTPNNERELQYIYKNSYNTSARYVLSDSKGIQTYNSLVCKLGLNHLAKLATLLFKGHSLLITCSSSDARMLLFNANFSACKLITD